MSETDMTTIEDPSASADVRLATAASLRSFMQLATAQRSAVILVDVLGLLGVLLRQPARLLLYLLRLTLGVLDGLDGGQLL